MTLSGNFEKRNVKVFMDAALLILEKRNNAHFMLIGSKLRNVDKKYKEHPIWSHKNFRYIPKNKTPERYMSAIDVFFYPAPFEEFGMVVIEAAAMGIPIVTSKGVGATEILCGNYQNHIMSRVSTESFAKKAIEIAENEYLREKLSQDSFCSVLYNDTPYGYRVVSKLKELKIL